MCVPVKVCLNSSLVISVNFSSHAARRKSCGNEEKGPIGKTGGRAH